MYIPLMQRRKRPFALVLIVSLAIVLSACGSSGSDTDDSGMPEVTPTSEPSSDQDAADDAGDASVSPATEAAAPAQDDDGLTAEDNGSGLVRVDGIEYPDFLGECVVHRGLDPETYLPVPVGDLSEPELSVVVGIDNVASAPAVEANFIMLIETNFRMAGLDIAGTIDSIAYIDPPATFGSVDLALVSFTGTTDDGIPVVAEVVCEIGLG